MNVQELVTKYTFEVDTKPLEKVQSKVTDLVGFIAKLSLAGATAAASVFAMAQSTANAGDEMLAMSKKTGIGTEALSQLQFAAKQSSVDTGTLQNGLKFLSKNMVEATKSGSETAITFQKMGIKVKDATGKMLPTEEVLLNFADKLKAMPDGAKKTATAMDVFGRAGADLIPLLSKGSAGIKEMMIRADELGLTMSKELAEAGDAFNSQMHELQGVFIGIRNVVGSQLLPILTPLIKRFTDFVVANRKIIASRLDKFFKGLASFVENVWGIFKRLIPVLGFVFNHMSGIINVISIMMSIGLAYYIGGLIISLQALNFQILLVGIRAAAAWIMAAAGPVAIGLAIMALILIFEDLWTFFTDPTADTFTKDLVGGFKEMWTWLTGIVDKMGSMGKFILDVLLTPVRLLVNTFKTLFDLINLVSGKTGFADTFKSIAGNIGNTLGGGEVGTRGLSEMVGFGPSSSPANTSTAQNNSQNNKVQVVNNINVGAGSDPLAVGKSVSQGSKDGLDSALRGAQRSFSPKGAF